MTIAFSTRCVWQIYRDKEQPYKKETLYNESRLQFSWRQFLQQIQCKCPNPILKRDSPSILKEDFSQRTDPFIFTVITTVDWSQSYQSFSSIEINKPLSKYLTRNSMRLKFVKKTSIPNLVEILEYIKCYSLGSTRPIKNSSSSIRYNCQKICS